jgi:hypothetical protein
MAIANNIVLALSASHEHMVDRKRNCKASALAAGAPSTETVYWRSIAKGLAQRKSPVNSAFAHSTVYKILEDDKAA